MKIVVVGGSGLIGSKLVALLLCAGHDVVRASRRSGIDVISGDTLEIGGPERFYLDGVIERVLGALNDPRKVITAPDARYFSAELADWSLVAGDEAGLGEFRFDEWLVRMSDQSRQHGAGFAAVRASLRENEFRIGEVLPGSVLLMGDVGVFNIEGGFCATQARCTHRQGPLSEGVIDGSTVTCPLHGARFNVWTGTVLRGPAKEPLKTYSMTLDGDIGRVEVPLVHAVQGA